MLRHLFRLSVFAIFITAVMVVITPVLTVNSLLYPIRVDSSYIVMEQLHYEKLRNKGEADSGQFFIYSPGQLQLNYVNYSVTLPDQIVLKGWLVVDSLRRLSPLILIIPDIQEGAIHYIASLKEFSDRGFNVCVMNMRGQGTSTGDQYDMANQAAGDLNTLVSSLKKIPFIEKIAVLGIGSGAAIAIKAFYDNPVFADVLLVQNPPENMNRFIRQHIVNEWGEIIVPLLPALKRTYESKTGIQLSDYDYENMLSSLYVPNMVIVANYKSKKTVDQSVGVYHSSNYFRKRLLIDYDSFQKKPGFSNSKKYYDKISAFVNSSLPAKTKKSRFRKLAQI